MNAMTNLKAELQKLVQGDVDDSADTLKSHSRDASLFDIQPELVVFPKDADDVVAVVKYVVAEKKNDPTLSVTARAAGTCMAGSSLTSSISLDSMKYMHELGEVREISGYQYLPHFPGAKPVTIKGEVHVQPGVFYRDLEPKTVEQGLLLPCFTASKSINALGGMVGNNSGGELSLKFGKTEDYIKDIEFVFSDGSKEIVKEIPRREAEARAQRPDFIGSVYKNTLALIDKNRALIDAHKPKVSKNSSGYNLWNVMRKDKNTGEDTVDLTQLIVGAEGTLGIMTGATMKLIKPEKESALLVAFLRTLDPLADIVQEMLAANPETIESYDDKTIDLAVRFWRGFIKQDGFLGALKLGIQFIPEFGMMIGGLPKLVIIVECTGDNKDEVLARLALLQKRLSKWSKVMKTRIVKDRAAGEKYWMIRRESFNLLRNHFQGKRTAPFVDDIIVPPATLPQFIPAIRKILDARKLDYSIAGHAGNGNFHIIPLIDLDARLSEKMILEVSEEVYSLVIRLGGSITAEHNDGIIRTPYLTDMFGREITDLFAQVKKIFDPQNIFNPGKKVGLTKADIGKYLIKG